MLYEIEESVTPSGIRVLTLPQKTRVGIETLVCGEEIYGVVRIRKGRRSDKNRALEKASVFDRLLVSEPLTQDLGDGIEITEA